ncbi:MAG: hypothetical protein U9Q06_00645 [Nanoarchaeota archaeon]|nr:hypothetical protein [Nanoarchaeota archaeon]
MENSSRDYLEGICPNCDTQSRFTYLGEQPLPGEESMSLYNCESCKSTLSSITLGVD